MSRYVTSLNPQLNFRKIESFQGVPIAQNRAHCPSLAGQKWSDLRGRTIDLSSAWNGGVAREVHACATWSPMSRKVDSASEAELDSPFWYKVLPSRSIRDGQTDPFTRGNRLTTTIEIGSVSTLVSLPCTSSLPSSYAMPPYGSYATTLHLFSIPTAPNIGNRTKGTYCNGIELLE
jgi:hypothetical protein